MGGGVEGLLDSRLRAGRGDENAAVFTCFSIASSNFISDAVLDISRKATAVEERVGCIDWFISVHEIHVFPATSFTADDVC